MRYTSFEFTNFKGIRHTRLDLDVTGKSARVFTLVGLNESGKTTVLQAIDHFQPLSGEDSSEVSPKRLAGWIPPDPHDLIPIAERTNFNGSVIISASIELSDEDLETIRKVVKAGDGFRIEDVERSIAIRDEYRFENSRFVIRTSLWTGLKATGYTKSGTKKRIIERASDARWQLMAGHIREQLPPIWYFPNFLFDFPARIYLDERVAEEAPRFYRALFQDILNALDRELAIEQHVLERARSGKASDEKNLDQLLLEAGQEVTKTVVSAWNRIFSDKIGTDKRVRISWSREDDDTQPQPPPEEGEEATPPKPRVYVEFRLEDGAGLFSIEERSLGFRWFFVYLLMTMYRGRRKGASTDMLFLFDEPASNLHSSAQSALLASFEELAKQASVVYTTHSHHLINPNWLGTTFVVTNEGVDPEALSTDVVARRTDIRVEPYHRFAAEHPNQWHYFQPILEVLDYAPSRLEMVPPLAMIEGKNDYYLLAYFQEVVDATTERINLMPGHGAGSLDRPIQLYIAWARPFVVLLDSDKAGQVAAAHYIELFGAIIEPRIVGLAEASGNSAARGIESLFTQEERLAFQSVAEGGPATTYRKKDFTRGVQEALVSRTEVPLSDATKKTLDDLLSTLRAHLENQS